MVDIPRSAIARNIPGPGGVSAPPALRFDPAAAALPAETLAAGTGRVSTIAATMAFRRRALGDLEDQARELGTVSKIEIETNARVSQRIEEARTKNPTTLGDATVKIYQEESQNLTKQVQGLSPASQKYLIGRFNSRAATQIPESRKQQTQAIHRDAMTATLSNIGERKKTAIAATDPTTKALEEAAITGMYGALVSGGLMTPVEADNRLQKDLVDIDTQRGTAMYLEDPDAFLTLDHENEFPNLDAEGIAELIGKATKEGDRRDKEIDEQDKKVREGIVDKLEFRAINGNLDPEVVDVLVGADLLEPEDRTKLLELQDDVVRRAADVVSDPDTLREVKADMHTEEPAVYRVLVTDLMRGENALLSREDGLALLKDAEQVKSLKLVAGYMDARKAIATQIGGSGLVIGLNLALDERVANAQEELRIRVGAGEDPMEIWPVIATKWAGKEVPQIVGLQRFKTLDEVIQAHALKQITDEQATVIIENFFKREVKGAKEETK